jgi:hypothetical protein
MTGCFNLTGTGYPSLKGPLGFLFTLNTKSLKLINTYISSAVASNGTFLFILLLTLKAGNYIRDPPLIISYGSGRF